MTKEESIDLIYNTLCMADGEYCGQEEFDTLAYICNQLDIEPPKDCKSRWI